MQSTYKTFQYSLISVAVLALSSPAFAGGGARLNVSVTVVPAVYVAQAHVDLASTPNDGATLNFTNDPRPVNTEKRDLRETIWGHQPGYLQQTKSLSSLTPPSDADGELITQVITAQ